VLFSALSAAFGDLDTVVRASRAVRAIHSRVHGTITAGTPLYSTGSPYTAHDQDALLWCGLYVTAVEYLGVQLLTAALLLPNGRRRAGRVLVTLFDGAMFCRETLLGELTEQERDEVVTFMADNAPVYGIDPTVVPKSYAEYALITSAWTGWSHVLTQLFADSYPHRFGTADCKSTTCQWCTAVCSMFRTRRASWRTSSLSQSYGSAPSRTRRGSTPCGLSPLYVVALRT